MVAACLLASTTQGHELVIVPGGTFQMGSPALAPPQHSVTLALPFALGRYETSVTDFAEFVRDSRSSGLVVDRGDTVWISDYPVCTDIDGELPKQFPACNVSWVGAVQYCNWLSRRTGLPEVYVISKSGVSIDRSAWIAGGYRLPTEAEWEWAARGPTAQRYPGSNGLDKTIANLREGKPVEVDRYFPADTSWAGISGLCGNVWEWVTDSKAPYSPKPQIDPLEFETGSMLRMVRGGGFADGISLRFDMSCRANADVRIMRPDLGFRVARSVANQE